MRAKKIAAATLALGMFALAGCSSSSTTESSGSSSAAGTNEPFKIVNISSISGPVAPFGAVVNASLEAAVNQINSTGGILGRQVEVTTIDDASDPTKAVAAAQEVVGDEDNVPDVVIPGNASLTTIPMLPVFARAGIPTVNMATSSSGNDPEKYPLNFGISNTPAQSIKALLGYVKDQGFSKVAVVVTDTETGQSTLKTVESEAAAAGITITGSEAMSPATVDATAALSSLEASDPDALLVVGIQGPLAGSIFKDRVKLGWTVPAFTDVVTTANDLVAIAGGMENLQGVTVQEVPYAVKGNPTQDTQAFKDFRTQFTAVMPDTKLPLSVQGAGWSALAFIQAIYDKAGTTDPASLTDAALSVTVPEAPMWFSTKGPSFGLTDTNHYITYGDYVYAPAGARDESGSLIVATQ